VLSSPKPNRIHILEPLVAERIAAGEVIERPGAVVKECVENSIDAGATIIHIHLEDGGKSLIEITDNGSGMTPDDLTLSIQRHATSKIQKLHDLFICWEGITAIHGNSPTLFEILNTLDESLRRTFLLECTIYYETHHEMGHVDVTTGTTPALEYATM
jgi:hypothetical protein